MSGLFDDLVRDAAEGEDTSPDALQKLQKVYGAESRAADVVAPRALEGRFRFAPGLGWLEWDGRRWQIGPACEERAMQAVREFIDRTEKDLRRTVAELEARIAELVERIASLEDADAESDKGLLSKLDDERQAARTQAEIWLNLLSEAKIGNVAKLSRRVPGILTDPADLDIHHDLLNCHNGVVDLRSGALRPHHPDLLITQLAGGDYDPSARCPQWERALGAVPPDALGWFQMRMGQALTGYMPDDDSLVLSDGGGENGKTTVMTALRRAAGSYYAQVSHRVLIAQPGQHPTELMDLRGVRLAVLEETPEEGRLDTHQLKMTVGTPQITARRMRMDSVTFDATHTLLINTNHVPQVDATDHGTWRRLKRMSWPYTFVKPGTEREAGETTEIRLPGDKALRPYIQFGADVPAAALAWLVAGAMCWYAQRDDPVDDPASVAEATREWRSRSDVAFQFATQRLIADPDSFITGENMRATFDAFLTEQGKHQWSAQLMNQRMPASLAEAGVALSATPAKAAKVRASDVESSPPHASGPPIPAGKVARIWRGVRFRTEAELSTARLRAV